jgi:alcohol dehydrogenase class IV
VRYRGAGTAFQFTMPTEVVFGRGCSRQVAQHARALGGSRVLVVTDRGVRAAGLVDPVVDALSAGDVEAVVFDNVAPNPRETSVADGAVFAQTHEVDLIVAVGGGSPMDTAKGISVVLTHGADILDYAQPRGVPGPVTPLIVIPTTAGSGSEVTFLADISDPGRARKTAIQSPFIAPRVALVDPMLTDGLPRALTASTGMDALAHAVEAATSSHRGPIGDSLALSAIALIARHLRVAYSNGADQSAREAVMLGSLFAGIAVANSSTGAAHCMAEAAAGLYDIPHGVANAIFLPATMAFNALALPDAFIAIAQALGEDVASLARHEAAEAAVRGAERLAADVRIPTAKEVGVRPDDLPRLAEMAAANPVSEGNTRPITEADYLELYRATS